MTGPGESAILRERARARARWLPSVWLRREERRIVAAGLAGHRLSLEDLARLGAARGALRRRDRRSVPSVGWP